LAASMIGENRPIRVEVCAGDADVSSTEAVSIGLIVTELIINAIKYAFLEKQSAAAIDVKFEMARSDWNLTVSDNGTGKRPSAEPATSSGLGTVLVAALAKQLKAQITEKSSANGLEIVIARATFRSTAVPAA